MMSLVKRRMPACACAAAAALCMTAFATSSAFAASKVTPDSVATTTSGGCGTLPYIAPNDPNGLLRKLGTSYPSSYVGWRDYPIVKSAWANWKPKRKSGYNIQILWPPLTNPLTNAALQGIKDTFRA